MVLYGQLTRGLGIGLLLGMLAYILVVIKTEKSAAPANDLQTLSTTPKPFAFFINMSLFVLGLTLTIFGAKFLVSSAIDIASNFGVSETVIGVTIVAVGTSLPELVTSLVASLKKQGNIAYGNIIGSNIYNVFGILGVTALIKPIVVPSALAQSDIWVMCGAALLLIISALTGWKVCRKEGLLYIALYAAYISAVISFGN
jgi:cation:H+ antiporter